MKHLDTLRAEMGLEGGNDLEDMPDAGFGYGFCLWGRIK